MRPVLPIIRLPGRHSEQSLDHGNVERKQKCPVNQNTRGAMVLRITGKLPPADGEIADSLYFDRSSRELLEHSAVNAQDALVKFSNVEARRRFCLQ